MEFPHNQPEFSVSEIAGRIKRVVEDNFGFVRIRGEISKAGVNQSSGHCYITLKDDKAVLEAVCWKGTLARLKHKPEAGMEVIVSGKLTTYAGRSSYQLVIEALEPAGIGALLAQLEARKKALEAEGLFAAARKKPLPYLPEVIGIVTSPTGAVIRDMLHRLADRFPRRVLLWPVAVQGASAAEQVAKAIAGFNAIKPGGAVPRPDLLIVARGGGSIEDLWAFNEEIVVRAAAASRIPLISAVGHETDTTLIDYASDFRAPTPSAAAERAVPVRDELRLAAGEYGQRLHARINERLARHREQVGLMGRALPRPQQLVAGMSQRLDEVAARLAESFPRGLEQRLHRLNALRLSPRSLMLQWQHAMEKLNGLSALLESLNVASVLKRGFAIVHDGSGRLVTSTAGVPAGGALALTFADGEKRVRIATEKPKAPSAQQSSLFEES